VITVVFACVHNAGRSQMAAAWFNAMADPTAARAISAGTEPALRIHPEVLEAMSEVGLDLSAVAPQLLTPAVLAGATHLVTMGCGEACPLPPPGVEQLDWPIADPKGRAMAQVRIIRDEVRGRVAGWIQERGWAPPGKG
jgi:arsenate reductase